MINKLKRGPAPLDVRLKSLASLQPKATAADVDMGGPLDLIVLSVKSGTTVCRLPGTGRVLTLRASVLLEAVPGRIITVLPRKFWVCSGHPYLSGDMLSARLDPEGIGLAPLKLEEWGVWDPREQDCFDDDHELEAWARPIVARGPRPDYEMETCMPGLDREDFDSDPIHDAVHLRSSGDPVGAIQLLMAVLQADLRCLDAHAHLGAFQFENAPGMALRYYETGWAIGRLSLGANFDGLLRWSVLENRPFLRCLHGVGICRWRLGRFEETAEIFERMLWLNPMDNQGARFMIDAVRAKQPWEAFQVAEGS